MLGQWLRSGWGAGRITTAFPRRVDQIEAEHALWHRIPQATAVCSGCSACQEVCPAGAISIVMESGQSQVVVNQDHCLACNLCIENCPQGVLVPGSLVRAEQVPLLANVSAPRPLSGETVAEKTAWRDLQNNFRGSLHIRHIDTGSCNACESEILALSNPYYNLHRLGFFFTASPRHADVLLVTGALTEPMRPVLLETYAAMPRPRLVIACGACALDGGLCRSGDRPAAGLSDVLPVNVKIPGCPPNPYSLLQGLLLAVGGHAAGASPPDNEKSSRKPLDTQVTTSIRTSDFGPRTSDERGAAG